MSQILIEKGSKELNWQRFLHGKEIHRIRANSVELFAAGKLGEPFWRLDPVIRLSQKIETACYAVLALSGIGALLYSVNVFFQ
jgi:hypothetical protein